MFRRYLTALFCLWQGLLSPAPALAVPTLTGPLINAVNTDKAQYPAGAQAQVSVSLVNATGASCAGGTLTGVMTGRGVTAQTVAAAIPTLAAGASGAATLVFDVPNVAYHGYHVYLTANCGGATLDSAAAAIDASPDWAHYARECFVSGFLGTSVNAPALAAGLNAWHCNVAQFYDVGATHQQPYTTAQNWTDLANMPVAGQNLGAYLAANRAYGIANFAYTLWNGAYPTFQTDGSGPQLAWGMFATACAPSCALANMEGTPSNGGSGALFPSGWKAAWLAETDPTNAAWQAYWIAANKPLLTAWGFDGLQIDTLGNPGTVYNYSGAAIALNNALSGFYNNVKASLDSRGVINAVSGWDENDVAANARQDFYYAERHPEFGDMPYYPSINAETANVRNYSYQQQAIDFPVYMDSTYSNTPTCISGGGATPCYFNLPGMLYIDAQMMASGAYHVYLADGDRFISNIYVPGAQLLTTPATIQAEYDYQTFGVAQEKLLRDGVIDLSVAVSLTGATGTTTGAAGGVFMLPKIRNGLQILHLLNYSQVANIDIQDVNANYPAPTTLTNVGVKMYYVGTVTGNNKLWFATPDVNHGAPQSITFAKGSDSSGNYITFIAPTIQYWDMFWLELDSLSTSDYPIP